jgi:hypothetical protein
MFKALLSQIFPPREVRDTIGHIRGFLKKHATFSRGIVQRKAIERAKQADKTITFITVEKKDPEHLALLLIYTVIGREIVKKEYKRSNKTVARDMLAVWDVVADRMREEGYISVSDYEKDCDWMNKRCTWLRNILKVPVRENRPDRRLFNG